MNTIILRCLSLAFLLLTAACGRSNKNVPKDDISVQEAEEVPMQNVDGANIRGTYLARFTTLNPQINGTIPGSAQLRRDDKKIDTFVRLFAGSPSVAHFQNVHMGNRCPTASDDINGDGFIDIQEAYTVVGPVIVPLDWDITSQLSANHSWPKAFSNGSYEYMQSANFEDFWADLNKPDLNPEDKLVKLAPDEAFTLAGKVVLIQGVGEEKELPGTVAGMLRWSNKQTFPIVCGVLQQNEIESSPDYEEEIPGPIAEIEEGQDRPASPGDGEMQGTGTVTSETSNSSGSNSTSNEEE